MKIAWKPVLFVLTNSVFVVILAGLLVLIKSVYSRPSDLMNLILIFPASLVFLIIGIFLFILGKLFPISLANKLLPFISVPALIGATGFTTSRSGMLAGMLIAAALIILAIFTTVASLMRSRGKAAAGGSTEEQKPPARHNVAAFIRWGTLGFGFGALVGVVLAWIIHSMVIRPVLIPVGTRPPLFSIILRASIPLFTEYASMGGVAGALIGGIVLKNPRKAWQLAIAGAAGFGLGAVLPYVTTLLPPGGGVPYGVLPGAITGAVGGAALGLAFKEWRKVAFLALAGMAIFSITHRILMLVLFKSGTAYFELQTVLVTPLEAAIAGAVLGAVLGYMEKGLPNQQASKTNTLTKA